MKRQCWSFHFQSILSRRNHAKACKFIVELLFASTFCQLNFKKKIGKFTLKDESEDDELQIGSYFAKKMQHGTMLTSPSSAAAARDASASIRLNAMTSKPSASTGSISTSVKKADQTASSEPKERQTSISKREPVKSATSNNKGHDSALPPSSNMGQLNEVKNNKKEEPQMGSSRQEVNISQ